MADNSITFYDFHKPVLKDGVYSVSVTQNLEVKDGDAVKYPSFESQSLSFHVTGPRFQLDTSLIQTNYPPTGGKGDYEATLPSLVLTRSTLPWERTPLPAKSKLSTNAPWLFLLLIDESETIVKECNGVELSTLASLFDSESSDPTKAGSPPLTQEDLSHLPGKINYIEIPSGSDSLATQLIPTTTDELQYLSYARIKDSNQRNPIDDIEEHAVLLCNRLPQKGHNSTVYLVSLENQYVVNGDGFSFQGIQKDGNYIFPYLYKWQFHAFDEELYYISEAIAGRINDSFAAADPAISNIDFSTNLSVYQKLFDTSESFAKALQQAFSIQKTEKSYGIIKHMAKMPGSTFHGLISNLAGGFAPMALDPTASDTTGSGAAKLPYVNLHPGQEGTASAWYRGPLAAGPISLTGIDPNFPLLTTSSGVEIPKEPNDLILSDPTGVEDATYAAAYELGRLTALNDVDFSTEFFKWKSETTMAMRLSALKEQPGYKNLFNLPLTDSPQITSLPDHVASKFENWRKLIGIPFRYLIPDLDLLPNESIRFFHVDHNWVNAFICGAFSIGHTVEADLSSNLKQQFLAETTTGFLINSVAVSGWPDFMVDVYPHADPFSLIRKDNLDLNIMLFLFSGSFYKLDFHLHPGKLHPGFLYEYNESLQASQFLKESPFPTDQSAPEGVTRTEDKEHVILTPSTENVMSITSLKTSLNASSVADFAAKIMEGSPAVVFNISG